jgi:hypothetical protein
MKAFFCLSYLLFIFARWSGRGQLDKGVTIDDRASAGGSRATVHDRRSTAAEEESGI